MDEVKRATDLEEAGEEVRGVDRLGEPEPARIEKVLQVAAELPVAGHPPAPAGPLQVQVVQQVGVALVEHEDGHPRVAGPLLERGRAAAQQLLARAARDAFRHRAQLGERGALPRPGRPVAPDFALRLVAGAQHRAFPVDELGDERVAVGETPQRFENVPFLRPKDRHGCLLCYGRFDSVELRRCPSATG